MDPHTRMLCVEAHRIFTLKTIEEVCNFVTTDDYQFFWSREDEFIQSSYSNIHFGHYKAIARDKYLSALQAAKLSGSPDDPTFGLDQGNGMASSGFWAIRTLMIEMYKQLGHASEFCGAWSGILFMLAAIIYVDDTDLLLVGRTGDIYLKEFFQQAQSAVMD